MTRYYYFSGAETYNDDCKSECCADNYLVEPGHSYEDSSEYLQEDIGCRGQWDEDERQCSCFYASTEEE